MEEGEPFIFLARFIYPTLFTIIMSNMILYQKLLNERRRTIYVS